MGRRTRRVAPKVGPAKPAIASAAVFLLADIPEATDAQVDAIASAVERDARRS